MRSTATVRFLASSPSPPPRTALTFLPIHLPICVIQRRRLAPRRSGPRPRARDLALHTHPSILAARSSACGGRVYARCTRRCARGALRFASPPPRLATLATLSTPAPPDGRGTPRYLALLIFNIHTALYSSAFSAAEYFGVYLGFRVCFPFFVYVPSSGFPLTLSVLSVHVHTRCMLFIIRRSGRTGAGLVERYVVHAQSPCRQDAYVVYLS